MPAASSDARDAKMNTIKPMSLKSNQADKTVSQINLVYEKYTRRFKG